MRLHHYMEYSQNETQSAMDLRLHGNYNLDVKAAAIALWSLRKARKDPLVWAFGGASAIAVPLSHAMSPFTVGGLDQAWELARQWSPLFAMLGGSLALAFLSHQEEFLRLVAPRTRWIGEWTTLVLASLALQGPQALGACVLTKSFLEMGEWGLHSLASAMLIASAGLLSLRLPATGTTRVIWLWIFLWAIPGLLG